MRCLFMSNPSNRLPLFCLQMQSPMLGCRGQQARLFLRLTSGEILGISLTDHVLFQMTTSGVEFRLPNLHNLDGP